MNPKTSMPAQHHLLTVGISLLTNFARDRNLNVQQAAKLNKEIYDFLQADPAKACAEINSLNSRTGFLDVKTPNLAVTLCYTETQYGKLCASQIAKELKKRNVVVHELPVRGVDAPARDLTPEFAAKECAASLNDLRQRVTKHITRLQRSDPPPHIEINCTGGYKAECAVLYELGRVLRLPVYYLHETFKLAVELP
jgi:putative CRISPR-associated protein (TIGR02619 family)